MIENYEIIFQIESGCEKYIKKHNLLSSTDVEKIIQWSISFFENGIEPHFSKLSIGNQLSLYCESTLYIVKLGKKKKALVSIDPDEIFDELIITLWALLVNDDYNRVFRSLGESMYQRHRLTEGDDRDE